MVEAIVDKAATLMEALPWIKAHYGKIVVIKYGGAAMTDVSLRSSVAQDIALMKLVGLNPVVVHGGGPAISEEMERRGLAVEFVRGLRVTGDEAMGVVREVLVERVNTALVGDINRHGDLAVGVAGDDSGLIAGRPVAPELGRAGEIDHIDPAPVMDLVDAGRIPVVATVGAAPDGDPLNINADLVAGRLAAVLGSEKVILLTDVDGLYEDLDDETTLVRALSLAEAEGRLSSEGLASGMIPKVRACVDALSGGVSRAHILNGTIQHALLLEVYTDEGVGTMITHGGAAGGGG